MILTVVAAVLVPAARPPVDAAMVHTFLAFGSTGWDIGDTGTDPGVGWRMTSFDASPWRNGALPVGTSPGVATQLATTAVTQYLTRTFSASLADVRLVRLRLRRDDGVLVYLNGRPVAKANMPFGEPTHTTRSWAATTATTYQEETIWLPREWLKDGTNRISVEVHQATPNDDAYLDLELTGFGATTDVTAPAAPTGSVAEVTGSAIRLSWTAPSDPSGIVAYRVRRGSNTLVMAQTSWGTTYLDQQLAPGSVYSYSVSAIDAAGNESSATVLSARTLLPAGTPVVRLQAVGDIGMGTSAQAMLSVAGAEPADAFIALGDLAYQAGVETKWCDMVRTRLNYRNVEVVPGNHEDDTGTGGNITNFAACLRERVVSGGTYPTNYYADFGSLVRLVVISPGLSVGGRFYDYFPINQERRWLIDTIAAGKAQGRWIVVALHKPCVSVGEKPCEIRADLMDVLTSADLLLAGHDHIYERTQQFRTGPGCTTFSSTWANPACVGGDGYGGTYTAGRGAVQVISGVGGQSQNALGAADIEWPYVVVANGRNSWSPADGYLRITATPSALAAEFRATKGQFGDSFTIRR